MRRNDRTARAGLLAGALAAALLLAATPAAAHSYGIFRNPSGSVHVRVADCGPKLCGTIVSASAGARADAARAGQHHIIGLQLFRDLEPAPDKGPRHWQGSVYIPDKDKTVSGEASLKGNVLTVKGCLIGDALCKAQDWVRIG